MASMKFPRYNGIKNNQKKVQQEQEKSEQAAKAEAKNDVVLDNVVVEGADTLAGTGYSNFRDLLGAKNKKVKDLQERYGKRQISNFASLLGSTGKLG